MKETLESNVEVPSWLVDNIILSEEKQISFSDLGTLAEKHYNQKMDYQDLKLLKSYISFLENEGIFYERGSFLCATPAAINKYQKN